MLRIILLLIEYYSCNVLGMLQSNVMNIQDTVVAKLEKKGFRFINSIPSFEEGKEAILLSKKPNHYSTTMAEVEHDGTVNGMSLDEYLKAFCS